MSSKIVRLRSGAILVEPRFSTDKRGEVSQVELEDCFDGLIVNRQLVVRSKKNVLRGMHYQDPSIAPLTKLVRCVRGRILEVVISVRDGIYDALVLDSEMDQLLIVPHWCAHGYLVVSDGATLHYGFDREQDLHAERAILWNSCGFEWPVREPILSDKDSSAPVLDLYPLNL